MAELGMNELATLTAAQEKKDRQYSTNLLCFAAVCFRFFAKNIISIKEIIPVTRTTIVKINGKIVLLLI